MTNIYDGALQNLEKGLGGLQREHETKEAVRNCDTPKNPKEWVSHLLGYQTDVADWKRSLEAEGGTSAKLKSAMDLTQSLISPVFNKDKRTGYYNKTGGNTLAAITDLWIEQDPIHADKPMRQAHIVEYDMINMEAVMRATERMIGAKDEQKIKGNKNRIEKKAKFTDGYIRIVNGLVRETFKHELQKDNPNITNENLNAYLHPIRQSNGDEFRLIVIGLSDDQVEIAMKEAQRKVQQFVQAIGFDALPHLKHLKDSQKWDQLTTTQSLNEPNILTAFKYGGAGIKIGYVALGYGKTTNQLEKEIDQSIHDNREERASARESKINQALEQGRTIFPRSEINNKASHGISNVKFDTTENSAEAFSEAVKLVGQKAYRKYYRENPKEIIGESLLSKNAAKDERKKALPANHPEHYVDEIVKIVADDIPLTNNLIIDVRRRLDQAFGEISSSNTLAHRPDNIAKQVFEIVKKSIPDWEQTYLEEDQKLIEKTLETHLTQYLSTPNPYESLDLTYKRILEKKAQKIELDDNQREIFIYKPLEFHCARNEQGICMNGKVHDALKIFQSSDQEQRQLSYIGLSSFAGVNEINTTLGRAINEDIRKITADELKRNFPRSITDYAYNVNSGRINLLTHGINKNDLKKVLSNIEIRVEKEINQRPLGDLLRQHQIFIDKSQVSIIEPKEIHDKDVSYYHTELSTAREAYGDTPLLLPYPTSNGYRPLTATEQITHAADIQSGVTIFHETPKTQLTLNIPEHIKNYLKTNGFAHKDDEDKLESLQSNTINSRQDIGTIRLDINKPLAYLTNPKYTHERGIRVITSYVELRGNNPELADKRKRDLIRIVEAKKRIIYPPGTGYDIDLPVESTPDYSALITTESGINKTTDTANASEPKNEKFQKSPAIAARANYLKILRPPSPPAHSTVKAGYANSTNMKLSYCNNATSQRL